VVDKTRKKLAVLVSGRGSNMEAILEASKDPDYPAEISLVLSDNMDAKGLDTASENGITAIAVPRKDYDSKSDHEAAIDQAINSAGADFVVLAGYMRILSPEFVSRHNGRLLNIHPSLLPRHKGLDTHARAIKAGDQRHGCSVHFVNAEMDGGAIIARSSLLVDAADTPETLASRVLKLEHRLYPQAIAAVARGDVTLENGELKIFGNLSPQADGTVAFP
jgi:formyltetrahydrofolate-dependent phosphoribosylglycinamide formyltransferase